jgi:phosphatidylserine decarboxylase
MSITPPVVSPGLTPAPIRSVQPGGGLCIGLELAWGRCRRWLLRRFWPGYVAAMLAKRQGSCTGDFDVIDPRDLKYIRNVCGYWFHPQDDAFAWRGRLGLARMGLAEVACFSLLFGTLGLICVALMVLVSSLFWLPLPVLAVLWLFVLSFFRDPERTPPTDPDLLVSPADGVVTHLQEIDDGDFPGGRAFRVSIFLSVFNVHVNRVPRTGQVVGLHYYPGAYLDARTEECAVRNEQFWIDLRDARTGCLVRTRQIAGAIARRIVCWLRPDEQVNVGERLGMIKFGSRTDLLLPIDQVSAVLVKIGQAVRGGQTPLLRMRALPGQNQ